MRDPDTDGRDAQHRCLPVRRRLPATRESITHAVVITDERGGDSAVVMIVGLYEDGSPGEVFLQVAKTGSTLNGFCDVVGRQLSYLLQYGVPLTEIAMKLQGIIFPPGGATTNPDIPECSSIVDYLFRWMELRFGGELPYPEGAA